MFAEQSEDARGAPRDSIVPFSAPALELTTSAATGDETACREFFNQYCDRLHRYLLVLTRGDDDVSREIVSIAMIKSIRAMRPMPTDAEVWRWLTAIARNAFIDYCRKNKRHISVEIPETLAAPNPDQTLTLALNESVAELSPEERDVIERYYYEAQSQLTLASAANTSRKAVESRLARIRQKLRVAILKKLS